MIVLYIKKFRFVQFAFVKQIPIFIIEFYYNFQHFNCFFFPKVTKASSDNCMLNLGENSNKMKLFPFHKRIHVNKEVYREIRCYRTRRFN